MAYLVRHFLTISQDPRDVSGDRNALHFGAMLSEDTLIPGPSAVLGRIGFQNWVEQRVAP